MIEIWKPVVGLENIYSVSNVGRIKRTGKARGARVGHFIRPQIGGTDGKYHKVILGRNHGRDYVHRIVAKAFHGPPPTTKHEVNHINGNTKDNRVDNLEWVTRSENNYHSYTALGRKASPSVGEKQWNSKLTEDKVREIRRLWATNEYLQRELADMFGVLQTTISRIVLYQSWKHIR